MKYNVIVLFSPGRERVLMCVRRKNPFQGKMNFVGGKLKPGEGSADAAYRELQEETGVTRADVALHHLADLVYPGADESLEAWCGTLTRDIAVAGDENELRWVPVTEDFADMQRFAGYGNVFHLLHYALETEPLS